MTNSKICKMVGIILLLAGAISLFVGIYKNNEANDMMDALFDGADIFGYDQSTYKSADRWLGHAESAKKLIIAGGVSSAIGMIFFVVGFFVENEVKHPEKKSDKGQLEQPVQTDVMDIKAKLIAIEQLKTDGLISEDEYTQRRKHIIDDL